MERRFQYYVPFTSHLYTVQGQGQVQEHNNTMQKLILNYTRLHEHTHLRRYAYYAHEEVDECAVTSERSVFVIIIIIIVKIANSNVMPMLRGFRWYPYFVA